MKPLLILGDGDFAVDVAGLVSEMEDYQVVGFVQNAEAGKAPRRLEGLPVLWVEEVRALRDTHWAVCAIGAPQRRDFTQQVAGFGLPFATLVHPTARVAATSVLGEGTIVSAGVVMAAYVRVGRHVILNRGALIGHHTSIGDWSTIGPGANIAGRVTIGDQTYAGIGAIVSDHLTIGKGCFLSAGALVVSDVADGRRVIGRHNPAQKS